MSFRNSSEMKSSAKPMIISAQNRPTLLVENISGAAMAISGRVRTNIFRSNPKKLMIQAVTVVPTFAPMITLAASVRESTPVFVRLMVSREVAEEDCTRAVIKKPVKIPVIRLLVRLDKACLIKRPDTF